MNTRPAMRDGVGASRVQVPAGVDDTVLAFLSAQFPAVGSAVWQERLQNGLVIGAEGRPLTATSRCHTGMTLFYYRALPQEIPVPFREVILYQDNNLLVVDKPHFLPVIPSGRFVQETLLVRLKKRLGIETLSPVHRIDKDTAGLVLFAVDPVTRDAYQSLFRRRAVHKVYEAWAPMLHGQPFPFSYRCRLAPAVEFFRTAVVAGHSNSETRVDVLEQCGDWARYQLEPVTGRKHQLRVHMAALGAPILHDCWYPHIQETAADDFSRPLQLLARSLAFVDPLNGEPRYFKSGQQLLAAPRQAAAQIICS